jgi:7,8-dihydropterin-6-yl-methyl-4-(beta-D-ribofuranosyl)aminobenzene 5'-phosphate synthase
MYTAPRASLTAALFLALLQPGAAAPPESRPRVQSLRIQILSTMLAESGVGEWGFAALVEADGKRFLVDTGARPRTVLENARELGVDLAGVEDVVLTHNHPDHTGGLLTLRQGLKTKNPRALSRAHVAPGIFWSRPSPKGEANPMIGLRAQYLAEGGTFVEHGRPEELYPGVWITGPVPRPNPERNWSGSSQVQIPAGQLVEDTIPEDQSVVFDTTRGLVLLSGCGHAGVVNTIEFARSFLPQPSLYAALGGFHLLELDDAKLAWTAAALKRAGLQQFVGAHCTGIEAVFRLRNGVPLERSACVVGAVGTVFALEKGIETGRLSR